jgi:hypothetical protein
MGGQEGTFEFAIDAPWRLEPVVASNGQLSYGPIPLVMTVTDENAIPSDAFDKPIGNFCDVTILQGLAKRVFAFKDLAEVEMTGNATTRIEAGSWMPGKPPPPHSMCRPGAASCEAFQSPHGTSEWYAVAWYTPHTLTAPTPGSNAGLVATMRFTRRPEVSCAAATEFLTMTNLLSVHYGEAPLPRFKDKRWAYGDLHYHSQGTDNEGESGYGYRGTIRAMGAMGLDFALAVEHASDSQQFVDMDYNGVSAEALSGNIVYGTATTLRDMNAQRFKFLHEQLWNAEDGANENAAVDGGGQHPPAVVSRNTAPQIYLGGEVDTIPELPLGFTADRFLFGNGENFPIKSLCGGFKNYNYIIISSSDCTLSSLLYYDHGIGLLRDVQGFNDYDYGRSHMVYFPRDGASEDAFISSRTGKYGGASRRLATGPGAILPEMEGGSQNKGYTFLAHPVPMGGCDGKTPGMNGDQGPDVVPYTASMLDQAFKSKAVLGLEFWNEDGRMENRPGSGAREIGFHDPSDDGDYGLRNDVPKGFNSGRFELDAWPDAGSKYTRTCAGVEWMLHHGLRTWDVMLLRGLWPSETTGLNWLPVGEPRRLFAAGGSDAHGDLNYHRAGYARGLTRIDDMAIGKPRNLVFAGMPAKEVRRTGVDQVKAFSHAQVLNGLINGNFAVTDGPALRIVIDKNGNGAIDDGDIPMGGIVEMYGDTSLPLLIQWDSSPEWGPIQRIELVIGAVNSVATPIVDQGSFAAIFAPAGSGPRTTGTPKSDVLVVQTNGPGRNPLTRRTDGYVDDPLGGVMRFSPPWSYSGVRKVEIPLDKLALGVGVDGKTVLPDRLYIRAYARSRPVVGTTANCAPDFRTGSCRFFYAFTNPVWAISRVRAAGQCPRTSPHSVDTDGDGLPNGCDPCPHTKRPTCGTAPPIGHPPAAPAYGTSPGRPPLSPG